MSFDDTYYFFDFFLSFAWMVSRKNNKIFEIKNGIKYEGY